ncbi:hypothetical protein BGP_1762 [Beggiatoa sp. PS]|nr:hypothetical protein BGP_1762 [Beggiatoa sp. PS]
MTWNPKFILDSLKLRIYRLSEKLKLLSYLTDFKNRSGLLKKYYPLWIRIDVQKNLRNKTFEFFLNLQGFSPKSLFEKLYPC